MEKFFMQRSFSLSETQMLWDVINELDKEKETRLCSHTLKRILFGWHSESK